MITHLLTTKNTKESKKHCRKSHFTKERPVLSKITKKIIAALHFWQKIGEESQRISFRYFRQNVYVLWFLYITRTFSCFLFISLLISSTLFTTTKYTIFKWKSCDSPLPSLAFVTLILLRIVWFAALHLTCKSTRRHLFQQRYNR